MSTTLFFCDDGLSRELDALTGHGANYDLSNGKVRLFSNNVTPTHATVLGDLTECTFPGYAAVALSSGNWGGSAVSSHKASITYGTTVDFTCSGGGSSQNVYGVYITDSAGTKLIAAGNLDAGPYAVVNNGDKVSVTPTVTMEPAA